MKIFAPLLLASLAINILLGALIVRKSPASVSANETAATQAAPVPVAPTVSSGGPSSREAATPVITTNTREPLWSGLKTDSFDEAIARLRAAGCPPRELAFAIRAMIQEWTMERRQALGYANETLPYWKGGQLFAAPRPNNEYNEIYLQAQRFERAYLLTPELFDADEDMLRSYRERFGPLDTEKLRRLAILESEHNEKSTQQFFNGGSTQPGQAAYAPDNKLREQVQKEREAAIQALLTPAEYAAYEARNSPFAMSLRYRLENFQPTEAEYLALLAVEKSRRNASLSEPLTPQQRKEANDAYQAAIKTALGPERAADYEALQQAGGDQLPRLIARLNLPLKTISAINLVRNDTTVRAKTIRENPEFSPEQRDAQLAALAAEAETDLSALFGTQRGVEAYKDLKGEWLRNLRPTPVPPGGRP